MSNVVSWGRVQLRVDRGREGGNRAKALRVPIAQNPAQHDADVRPTIARFFRDLRGVLGITPHQAAAQLLTHADVIHALEACDIGHLPTWQETNRIVMAYAGWARIDGRPVLAALAGLIRQTAARRQVTPANAARPPSAVASERFRRAGTVLKEGAKRLPKDAYQQARHQPARTLYAVSLPVGVLVVLMNTSILQTALAHLPGPLKLFSHRIEAFVATQFAPVHEGYRWIAVDDPRSRRADRLPTGQSNPEKLQTAGQSD